MEEEIDLFNYLLFVIYWLDGISLSFWTHKLVRIF